MNYRDEMQHDLLLIALVSELSRINSIQIISDVFQIPTPGILENAQRRKPFDVELTFSNYSCVIETTVDSHESAWWGDQFRTEIIVKSVQSIDYLKKAKQYLFITYGTSEYYTKPYDMGPASKDFRHIKLNDMIEFVSRSLEMPLSNPEQFVEWLSLMRIEQKIRASHADILKDFSELRKKYFAIHDDIDFPYNRFSFCAPELAFPALGGLAEYWNKNKALVEEFGRIAVYPISRMIPPVDDFVMNFYEMWRSGKPELGNKIAGDLGAFYFEINDDYNLNLKLDSDTLPEDVRDEVWSRLKSVQWPEGIRGRCRDYRQGVYVLYEWDFDFLSVIDKYEVAGQRLASIIKTTIEKLA